MNASQYNKINELLADFSTASTALERAEANIKTVQLEAAKTLLPEYAQLKIKVSELEAAIHKLCEEHNASLFPDPDKRSHKTPFGEVKYHRSSSLEFDDTETVVLKIQVACAREEKEAAKQNRVPRFIESQLLHVHFEPNLEVLTTMDDSTISLFGIHRETKDNFKVTPFALKTDKPGKAAKKEAA